MTANALGIPPELIAGAALDLRADLIEIIGDAIEHHPRSLQTAIGPSEVGEPCARKLGHKLAGTPVLNQRGPAWRPTVGTAVHTWLADVFTAHDKRKARWLIEHAVTVGEIDGVPVSGHSDLFDAVHGVVIDWKIPGPSTMKRIKATREMGATYRAQMHLYGRGFQRAGLGPMRVAIAFLPSAGELTDAIVIEEKYDEALAVEALTRASGIAAGLRILGPAAILPQLSTAPSYCHLCPWFVPGATDLTTSCPGDESITAKAAMPPASVTGLVGPR